MARLASWLTIKEEADRRKKEHLLGNVKRVGACAAALLASTI
jgi:hypothetical protein